MRDLKNMARDALKKLEPYQEEKKTSIFNSWLFLILLIGSLSLSFRIFLFEPFHIPSASMKPTLLEGDFIFVSKNSYGISRYSILFGSYIPYFEGRKFAKEPERGDVIVFRPSPIKYQNYVKRLIGLPGDKIQIKNGQIFINDVAVSKIRIKDFELKDKGGQVVKVPQYVETLPNGVSFNTLDLTKNGKLDNTRVFNVPQGHYFLMGDNRDDSADSRVEEIVGFVPYENLIGRANIIAISTRGRLWQFWRWHKDFRGQRIWQDIDFDVKNRGVGHNDG